MGKSTDAMKGIIHNGGREKSDKIQHDIDMTRADMDETVDAIQSRLSPQQLVTQALDLLRDAVKQGTPKMMTAIKHNPVPSSLIALGVGWLILKSRRHPTDYDVEFETGGPDVDIDEELLSKTEIESGSRMKRARRKMGEFGSSAKEKLSDLSEGISGSAESTREKMHGFSEKAKGKFSEMSESAREKFSDLTESAREKMSGLGDKSSRLAHRAAERARRRAAILARRSRRLAGRAKSGTFDFAGNVKEKTSDVAGYVGSATVHGAQRVRRMAKENPLALAAIALGVGATIAWLLPRTRREDELMGLSKEQLKEKAIETGQQTMQKVENIARAAGSAAEEEIHRQGLNP